MFATLAMAAALAGDVVPPRTLLSGSELAEVALRAARADEPQHVRLSVQSLPKDMPLPPGTREISVLPSSEPALANRRVQRLSVRVDGRLIGIVAVPIQRSVLAEGWVYAEDHRAGTDAQRVRLQRATVDFASRQPLAPSSFQPPAETRLRRRVRAGTVVRSDDFEIRPSVTRLSEVTVHRQGEGVRVSRSAIVLEDAFAGDATRVRIGDRVLRVQVSKREDHDHAL